MKYDVTIVIVGGAVPVIFNRGRRGPIVLHFEKRHYYDYYVGTPAEAPLFEIDQTEARGLRGGAKKGRRSIKSGEAEDCAPVTTRGHASKIQQEDEGATPITRRSIGILKGKAKSSGGNDTERKHENRGRSRGADQIQGSPPMDDEELDDMIAQVDKGHEAKRKLRDARRQSCRRKKEY